MIVYCNEYIEYKKRVYFALIFSFILKQKIHQQTTVRDVSKNDYCISIIQNNEKAKEIKCLKIMDSYEQIHVCKQTTNTLIKHCVMCNLL